jgi:hypothetical protein
LLSLEELAHERATGEFIVVSRELEVHVFFQQGRVAWGTSSVNRFAFSRHLFHSCSVDRETLRSLIQTCQQEHRPLGETLVSWGLATWEEVRSALASQLSETLQCISELEDAQTLFLPRSTFADYDTKLTFALDEIIEQVDVPANAREVEELHLGSARDVFAMFEELKSDVPDSLWMELVTPEETTSAPSATSPAVGAALAPIFLDGHTDFVALRTGTGTILGGSIPGHGESLWAGLGKNATIGNALSALAPVLSADLSPASKPGQHARAPWTVVGTSEETLTRVRSSIEHADEVLAAFSLDDEGELQWACARESLPLIDIAQSAQRHARALDMDLVDSALDAYQDGDTTTFGYLSRSVVIADPRMWTYGSRHRHGSPGALWLCVDRSTSQGLGWAILTSLSRLTNVQDTLS